MGSVVPYLERAPWLRLLQVVQYCTLHPPYNSSTVLVGCSQSGQGLGQGSQRSHGRPLRANANANASSELLPVVAAVKPSFVQAKKAERFQMRMQNSKYVHMHGIQNDKILEATCRKFGSSEVVSVGGSSGFYVKKAVMHDPENDELHHDTF